MLLYALFNKLSPLNTARAFSGLYTASLVVVRIAFCVNAWLILAFT